MNDKLKKLTEELYNEGLQKGQKEADVIILNAKKEAEQIIKDATDKAKIILANAEKESKEIKHKTEMDLQLSSKQIISKIKKDISSLITFKSLEQSLSSNFNNVNFIEKLILTITKSWQKDSTGALDLSLYLPSEYENEIKTFLQKNCKEELDKGLNIAFSHKIINAIKVVAGDNSYSIDLSEESFKTLLMEYLRPTTKELLFS